MIRESEHQPMGVDRRQVLVGSASVVALAGCLNEESLGEPFALRIENRDTQPRELSVLVEHVSQGEVYNETHQLPPDEQIVETDIAVDPGRYQIEVVDTTTDDEWTDELHVELTTGEVFCGWFQIWTEPESVTVTVPRCPNDETDSDEPAADDPG